MNKITRMARQKTIESSHTLSQQPPKFNMSGGSEFWWRNGLYDWPKPAANGHNHKRWSATCLKINGSGFPPCRHSGPFVNLWVSTNENGALEISNTCLSEVFLPQNCRQCMVLLLEFAHGICWSDFLRHAIAVHRKTRVLQEALKTPRVEQHRSNVERCCPCVDVVYWVWFHLFMRVCLNVFLFSFQLSVLVWVAIGGGGQALGSIITIMLVLANWSCTWRQN